jgi:hypothetical protein
LREGRRGCRKKNEENKGCDTADGKIDVEAIER